MSRRSLKDSATSTVRSVDPLSATTTSNELVSHESLQSDSRQLSIFASSSRAGMMIEQAFEINARLLFTFGSGFGLLRRWPLALNGADAIAIQVAHCESLHGMGQPDEK